VDPLKLQYVIELLKQGDGASQATAELQRLQAQGAATKQSMTANSASLDDLSKTSKTASASIKAMQGTLTVVGLQTFPQATMAAHLAKDSIKAVQLASAATGAGLALTSASIIGVTAALYAGVEAWRMYRAELDETSALTNLQDNTARNAKRLIDLINRETAAGHLKLSAYQQEAFDRLLANPRNEERLRIAVVGPFESADALLDGVNLDG